MKLWRLLGVFLFIGGVSILSACGDSNFDEQTGGGVAFTPTPAPTPIPKLCGNGEIDAGEECDPPEEGACTGDQECVCCLCLSPGEELGTRTFTFARPPTGLFSSALNGVDVVVGLNALPGPLVMRAGRPDPDLPGEAACSASITLEQDTIIGFEVPVVGFACTKLFAEGSMGTIDCDGGTAHNVDYVIDSNGTAEEGDPVIRTGLGRCCTMEDGLACAAAPFEVCDPEAEPSDCAEPFPVCSLVGAGPGAATVQSPLSLTITILPAPVSSLQDCNCLAEATTAEEVLTTCDEFLPDDVDINTDVTVSPVALTTEIGRGTVLNPSMGGAAQEIERVGENFTCTSWTEADSEGILDMPLAGLDQIIGDTINIVELGDQLGERGMQEEEE